MNMIQLFTQIFTLIIYIYISQLIKVNNSNNVNYHSIDEWVYMMTMWNMRQFCG